MKVVLFWIKIITHIFFKIYVLSLGLGIVSLMFLKIKITIPHHRKQENKGFQQRKNKGTQQG